MEFTTETKLVFTEYCQKHGN